MGSTADVLKARQKIQRGHPIVRDKLRVALRDEAVEIKKLAANLSFRNRRSGRLDSVLRSADMLKFSKAGLRVVWGFNSAAAKRRGWHAVFQEAGAHPHQQKNGYHPGRAANRFASRTWNLRRSKVVARIAAALAAAARDINERG